MIIMFVDEFQVSLHFLFKHKKNRILFKSCFTGKQAVLVLQCDNTHMSDDVMVEPGLVMIFAHGIE